MGITSFPRGISSFGVPVIGSGAQIPVTTGSYWFVDSNTGSDSNSGMDKDHAFATLDYAVGKCTASKMDVIILMPGHAESLTTATSCVIDVAGVYVCGLGNGSLQPTFTLKTATTAILSVTAANVTLDNIRFVSDIANLAVGVNFGADADGGTVVNCLFEDGAANKEMKIMLNTAAGCNRMTIANNRFLGFVDNDADTGAIILAGASNYTRIIGNYVHGLFKTTAPIDGSAVASTNLIIADNVINNADTSAGLTIQMHASTTGVAVRNLALGAKDTVHLVLAGMMVAENYDSNAAGASAIIKPAVDS